ncbi:MAG: hypothetical protein J2P25_02445 [Nocardiopsaceae bacterium]|nr:hypothetical protein [Nocardiopsaceae bacterium]
MRTPRLNLNRPEGQGQEPGHRRTARLPGERWAWRGIIRPKWRGTGRAAGAALLALAVWQLSACAPQSQPEHVTFRPAPPIANASLTSVAVLSPSSAWAVGDTTNSTGMIVRWNGKKWKSVPVPTQVLGLTSVSASSPSSAWAVGYNRLGDALSMHWNGTEWRPVRVPMGPGDLNAVAADTARNAQDAWAVGDIGSGKAVALHWDGGSWQPTSIPASAARGTLFGVTAISPDDAWAVGRAPTNTPLVLHWNGTAWSQMPYAASTEDGNSALYSVTVVSPDNAWAVGAVAKDPIIAHWNGKTWQNVPSPIPQGGGYLNGVAATSANGVWATGQATGTNENVAPNALIEHWNGNSWQLVPSGTAQATGEDPTDGTQLFQVGAAPPGTSTASSGTSTASSGGAASQSVWLVGTDQSDTGPVIMRWDGTAWKKQSFTSP